MTSMFIARGVLEISISVLLWSIHVAGRKHQADLQLLGRICQKNQMVPLANVNLVKDLIKLLRDNESKCRAKYMHSFYELEEVLALSKDQSLCSESKFEQIKEYHFRYIMPSAYGFERENGERNFKPVSQMQPLSVDLHDHKAKVETNEQIMIPIALQHFFKAWAIQVSGLCKLALMRNLPRAVQQNMGESDLEIIDTFVQVPDKDLINPLGDQNSLSVNFDDAVYMPELEGHWKPELDLERSQSKSLDLRSDKNLYRLMKACKLRFSPIYRRLLIPVMRMAKLGYNYVGPHLDEAYENIEKDPLVISWIALTAICESEGEFELIELETDEFPMEEVNYVPLRNFNVEDELWIKSWSDLDKELDRIQKRKSTGFKKFRFRLGVKGNKFLAKIDPTKTKFYQKHSDKINTVLNLLSIGSNVASILSSAPI